MWLPWSGRLHGREEEQGAERVSSDLCTLQVYFLLAGVHICTHYFPLTGYGDLEGNEFKSLDCFLVCGMSVGKGSVYGSILA